MHCLLKLTNSHITIQNFFQLNLGIQTKLLHRALIMAYGLYNPNYTPGLGSRPRYQTTHPYRHLAAAGSHLNNQWDNGHSNYG